MEEKKGIFIVEDDPSTRKLLKEILEREDFDLYYSDSSENDTSYFESVIDLIALIIIDISIEGERDGFKIAKKMKQDSRYQDIPIIFLSGSNESSLIIDGYGTGGSDFITRPIHASALREKIVKIITQYNSYILSGYSSFEDFKIFHSTKNIVYLSENLQLCEKNILLLEGSLNVKIIETHSLESVLKFLSTDSNFHLIICENSSIKEVKQLTDKVHEDKIKISIFLIYYGDKNYQENELKKILEERPVISLFKDIDAETLESKVQEELRKRSSLYHHFDFEDNEQAEFAKIRPVHVYKSEEINCDIFIRLGSNKYLKILNKNDKISRDRIQELKKINCSFFYVKRVDFGHYVGNLSTKILNDLKNDQKESHYENTIIVTNELVKEMIRSLGISQKVIELSDSAIKKTYDLIDNNPSVKSKFEKGLLGQFEKEKEALFVSYISCGLAYRIDESNPFGLDGFNKFCIASFFHDITLEEEELDFLFMAKNIKELKDRVLIKKVNTFKRHPLDASLLMKKFEISSTDVDNMILHHHEHPAGTGFPYGIGAQQIPLFSAIFIVAHEFIYRFYQLGIKIDSIHVIIEELVQEYNQKKFKKVGKALQELFK